MPFNGAGSFTLVTGNPVVTGTVINSTVHNNTNNDIASGLTNCITRDGQSAPSANLPMGGFKHTGATSAAANGQYIVYGQSGASLASLSVGGSSTKGDADQLRLDLADTASAANGAGLVQNKYDAVGSAALNLHSYIEDDGSYNVMGFIPEALKSAIRNQSSSADHSSYVQAAITAAFSDLHGLRLPRGLFNVGNLSLTMTGNRLTQAFTIRGAGRNATVLKQFGTPTEILKFTSTNPATTHASAQLVIADMKLMGITSAGTGFGLTLAGVSEWLVERMILEGFTTGANISSSLVGEFFQCQMTNNAVGLMTRLNGTNAYCNAIKARKCHFAGNSSFGLDIGAADGFILEDSTLEQNGTTANTATGAIMVRATCDDETGYGQISLMHNKFEVNKGRAIQGEAAASMDWIIDGGYTLASESGRDIFIAGARRVKMSGFNVKSNPGVIDITCDQLLAQNVRTTTLTDSGVTTPTYINVEANGTTYYSGQTGSFTGTLTNVTGTPTGTIKYTKQGDEVQLVLDANLIGASTTTAAPTITGMPASLRPAATRQVLGVCQDNSAEKASVIGITNAGVINLANGFSGTFTNTGNKGISAQTLPSYKI